MDEPTSDDTLLANSDLGDDVLDPALDPEDLLDEEPILDSEELNKDWN